MGFLCRPFQGSRQNGTRKNLSDSPPKHQPAPNPPSPGEGRDRCAPCPDPGRPWMPSLAPCPPYVMLSMHRGGPGLIGPVSPGGKGGGGEFNSCL